MCVCTEKRVSVLECVLGVCVCALECVFGVCLC